MLSHITHTSQEQKQEAFLDTDGAFSSLFYEYFDLFSVKKNIMGPRISTFRELYNMYGYIYFYIYVYVLYFSKKAMKVKLSWEHTYSKILKSLSNIYIYMCIYEGETREVKKTTIWDI